mmetsp:Transcript_1218/g.1987  ORF Transcript_1218/g.1987 Transcript_1218/m.1987 type:complete len:281 (+) Transcript_1218:1256-2098(+)
MRLSQNRSFPNPTRAPYGTMADESPLFDHRSTSKNHSLSNAGRSGHFYTFLLVTIMPALHVFCVSQQVRVWGQGVDPPADNIPTYSMVRARVKHLGGIFFLYDICVNVFPKLPIDHFILDEMLSNILVVEVVAKLKQKLWRAYIDLAIQEVCPNAQSRARPKDIRRYLNPILAHVTVKKEQLRGVPVVRNHQIIANGAHVCSRLNLLHDYSHYTVAILLTATLVECYSLLQIHVRNYIAVDKNKWVRSNYPHCIKFSQCIALRETRSGVNTLHCQIGWQF